jgi:hypothetical protein
VFSFGAIFLNKSKYFAVVLFGYRRDLTLKSKKMKVGPKLSEKKEALDLESFHLVSQNEFANIYWVEEHKAVLCVIRTEFIPFDAFQEIFLKAGELSCLRRAHKFIFDKRNLRAFHQPSMEWYFLYWKKEMLSLGLRVHRKILPQGNWFDLAVKTCREELERRPEAAFLKNLDIQYRQSIKEALES